jgi:hypothetical protein
MIPAICGRVLPSALRTASAIGSWMAVYLDFLFN